jgi:hypothetical protein
LRAAERGGQPAGEVVDGLVDVGAALVGERAHEAAARIQAQRFELEGAAIGFAVLAVRLQPDANSQPRAAGLGVAGPIFGT